jgi:hypothetical protein
MTCKRTRRAHPVCILGSKILFSTGHLPIVPTVCEALLGAIPMEDMNLVIFAENAISAFA